LQTSQGYIIRILQHFATKLWNITNFVMLFQAVMKFLSRLVSKDQNLVYYANGQLKLSTNISHNLQKMHLGILRLEIIKLALALVFGQGSDVIHMMVE
jgi:uncharacterized YccA/Bax inhibitor family protein